MMILRFMYMLVAFMVLLPIIVAVEIGWFVYLLYLTHDFKKTVVAWFKYLYKGIEMNVDFIINGF